MSKYGARDVGSIQPVDLGDGHGFELSHGVDAGAVHEDVDRTDVETQLLAEAQHAVVVRQIDDVARGLGAVTGGFGRPESVARGTAYKTKPRVPPRRARARSPGRHRCRRR